MVIDQLNELNENVSDIKDKSVTTTQATEGQSTVFNGGTQTQSRTTTVTLVDSTNNEITDCSHKGSQTQMDEIDGFHI